MYSGDMSMPMNLRPDISAILPVVADPHIGSMTRSPGLLHDCMWSSASFSGNMAGCWNATLSLVLPPSPTA